MVRTLMSDPPDTSTLAVIFEYISNSFSGRSAVLRMHQPRAMNMHGIARLLTLPELMHGART